MRQQLLSLSLASLAMAAYHPTEPATTTVPTTTTTMPEPEEETCEWIGGSYGLEVRCLTGWVAKGICGSTTQAKCRDPNFSTDKYYFMLKCCETKYQTYHQTNCQSVGFNAGDQFECKNSQTNANQAFYGGCGSGWHDDCKANSSKYANTELCCDNKDITVADDSLCHWQYGSYGDLLECAGDEVAAGHCGSKSSKACETGDRRSKNWNGLKCCRYSDRS